MCHYRLRRLHKDCHWHTCLSCPLLQQDLGSLQPLGMPLVCPCWHLIYVFIVRPLVYRCQHLQILQSDFGLICPFNVPFVYMCHHLQRCRSLVDKELGLRQPVGLPLVYIGSLGCLGCLRCPQLILSLPQAWMLKSIHIGSIIPYWTS